MLARKNRIYICANAAAKFVLLEHIALTKTVWICCKDTLAAVSVRS